MATIHADAVQAVQPAEAPAPAPREVFLLNLDVERDLRNFDHFLRPAGYRVRACASIQQARELVARTQPIAGLLHLGGTSRPQLSAIEGLLEVRPTLRLVALVEPTPEAREQLAPLIRRDLIYDYHTLPLDLDRLLHCLGHISGLVAVERDLAYTPAPPLTTEMVGRSPAIRRVGKMVDKIARAPAPVLIRGESGTGKELVARALHHRSARAAGPFVPVNCAALPPSLIGSELFGHEKGAFTGALARKIGRIETADGGTLFLDEIGDLPLELQGHFLRFLQEQTIDRLGGTTPIKVDVRVVAATHVDLTRAQSEGRFREDLFYRLNVLSIELPPLRERGDDVELLAEHYLKRFGRELGRPLIGFRDGALQALRAYPWPGNVRELISCVQRAAVMAEGRWVTVADLGLGAARSEESARRPTLQEARAELEKRLIQDALQLSGQNVQAAARQLGVSRMTLYRLLDRYGLGIERDGERPARPASPGDQG
jgi:DNA-binding NtrC family response regulator